jgi:hypothetical protein
MIRQIDFLVARQSVRHLVLAGSTDIVAKTKDFFAKAARIACYRYSRHCHECNWRSDYVRGELAYPELLA